MINADTLLNELFSLAQKGRMCMSLIMTSLTFWLLWLNQTHHTSWPAMNESVDVPFSLKMRVSCTCGADRT